MKATPDQIWAFDTDYLRRKAEALRPVGRHYTMRIRFYTLSFYALMIGSVVAAFTVGWWATFALIGLACVQRQANYRLAGELAAKAATASSDPRQIPARPWGRSIDLGSSRDASSDRVSASD